jgi:hypothetical protein
MVIKNDSPATTSLRYLDNLAPLAYTIDLDSLFGYMPFEVFARSFKCNILLELDNIPKRVDLASNHIKTDHILENSTGRVEPIKTLPHVRLGTASTSEFGSLDLYLLLSERDYPQADLKNDLFTQAMANMCDLHESAPSCMVSDINTVRKNNEDSGKELRCILSKDDFCKVFARLFEESFKHYSPLIYFETFGNKRSTITNSSDFQVIRSKIISAFDPVGFDFIYIDTCISTSCGPNTITLPRPSFFKAIKLVPNCSQAQS